MTTSLQPGLSHTKTYVVPEDRTVPHLLPESPEFGAMPEVLATGYLVGLIEWTCIEALEGHLADDEITLGTQVDLTHVAPTVPGSTLTIDVTLVVVDGRNLTFEVAAHDDHAVVSTGLHDRGVVDRGRFEERIARRRALGA